MKCKKRNKIETRFLISSLRNILIHFSLIKLKCIHCGKESYKFQPLRLMNCVLKGCKCGNVMYNSKKYSKEKGAKQ